MTRIPTLHAFDRNVAAMNERRTALLRSQDQLSTGKRVNSPSDDPLAAAQAERARSQLSRIDSERRMMDYARHMLGQAENVMAGVGETLNFARENLVAAGNGALGPSERALIAQELRGTRDGLLALANQGNGVGGYVFGGQGSAVAPFAAEGQAAAATGPGEQSTGGEVTFTTSQDGRAIFGGSGPGAPGIFETIEDAIALLENPASTGTALTAGLRDAMTGVDSALEKVLIARTRSGEQLRAIDSRERLLGGGELEARGRISDLVEVDHAAAISEFQSNQVAIQAAMTSYAQIARLSLFDHF